MPGTKSTPCQICGTLTKRKYRRFCSPTCRGRARRLPAVVIECARCGASIEARGVHALKRVYCSRACLAADRPRRDVIARFWAHVSEGDGCWHWNGINNGQYGNFEGAGAHRFSYELHYGPIPEGLFVLHSCDNRSCVRPQHLRLGTRDDNLVDAIERRRIVSGERHYKTKFTARDVRAVRQLASEGWRHAEIAARFDVSRATIGNIINRKTWKYVE